MSRQIKQLLIIIIAIIIFAVGVDYLVGWPSIWRSWSSLSTLAQTTTLLLLGCSYLIRGIRNYDYFYRAVKGRWFACLRMTLIHNALNNVMPMRSGEVSFPLLMRNMFSVGLSRSIPGLLLMRIMDLYVLLMLGALFMSESMASLLVRLSIILLLSSIPLLVFPLRSWLLRKLLRWRRLKPARLMIKLLAGTPRRFSGYLRCYLWGWANWTLKLALLAWLLTAFTGVGLPGNLLGAMGGELTSILPINPPGGLGAYEAGVVAGLSPFMSDNKTALSAAVNIHLLILIASIISALCAAASTLFRKSV